MKINTNKLTSILIILGMFISCVIQKQMLIRFVLLIMYIPAVYECSILLKDNEHSEKLSIKEKYNKIAMYIIVFYMMVFTVSIPLYSIYFNQITWKVFLELLCYNLPGFLASLILIMKYSISDEEMYELRKKQIVEKNKYNVEEISKQMNVLNTEKSFIDVQNEKLRSKLNNNPNLILKIYYGASRNYKVNNLTYIKENRFSYRITKSFLVLTIIGAILSLCSIRRNVDVSLFGGLCLIPTILSTIFEKKIISQAERSDSEPHLYNILKKICVISTSTLIFLFFYLVVTKSSFLPLAMLLWIPGIALNIIFIKGFRIK